MRAVSFEGFGGPEVLQLVEAPEPLVGPDSVLVRVMAAGVNVVDAKIRAGHLAARIPHVPPVVPGWDAAGVVEEVGPAVTAFAPGDEVYGYFRKDFVRDGTYAEAVTLRDAHLARKPEGLSFEEAAAVPLAGLTAWQVVHDALKVRRGELVLVLGASGGVGTFAVQLVRAAGAHVIGVARAENHDLLRDLGAAEVADYRDAAFVDVVTAAHHEGVDAVVDCVGGEARRRSLRVVRPGGRLCSILVPPPAPGDPPPERVRASYVFVHPDAGQLRLLGQALAAGDVRVELSEVLGLEHAAVAHRMIEGGHTRGKLVLRVE